MTKKMTKKMKEEDRQKYHRRIVEAVAVIESGLRPPVDSGFRVHPPIYYTDNSNAAVSLIWYGPTNPKPGQDPWPWLVVVQYDVDPGPLSVPPWQYGGAVVYPESGASCQDKTQRILVQNYGVALGLIANIPVCKKGGFVYRDPRWPRPRPHDVPHDVSIIDDLLDDLDDPRPNPVSVTADGPNDLLPPEFAALRDAVRHARRALTDALGVEPAANIVVDAAREIIRARLTKMPS